MIYLIVPCYNEQDVIESTTHQLINLFPLIPNETQILYIDDGSTDSTWTRLLSLGEREGKLHAIRLSHNVGQQIALWAGIETCIDKAEAIITLDADLQTDIDIIPKMVQDYLEGADVVYGVKRNRSYDTFIKRWMAQGFYKLLDCIGCDSIYNHADYRLLSCRACCALLAHPERDLYLRGLIPQIGFNTKIEYFDIKPRRHGTSKYSVSKMFNLALRGITGFSARPLRCAFFLGFLSLVIAFVILVATMYDYLSDNQVHVWTIVIMSIWLLASWILLSLGIIGEYIWTVLIEVKRRPRFFVMDKMNME